MHKKCMLNCYIYAKYIETVHNFSKVQNEKCLKLVMYVLWTKCTIIKNLNNVHILYIQKVCIL